MNEDPKNHGIDPQILAGYASGAFGHGVNSRAKGSSEQAGAATPSVAQQQAFISGSSLTETARDVLAVTTRGLKGAAVVARPVAPFRQNTPDDDAQDIIAGLLLTGRPSDAAEAIKLLSGRIQEGLPLIRLYPADFSHLVLEDSAPLAAVFDETVKAGRGVSATDPTYRTLSDVRTRSQSSHAPRNGG